MGLEDSNSLQQLPSHPHIYMYPSGKNIYPWLAEASALVTDYSSIAYDFLLSDKPIVYFQYDKADYVKLRGQTMVSDKYFIAGKVVSNTSSLLKALDVPFAESVNNVLLRKSLNIPIQDSINQIIGFVRNELPRK